MMQQVKTYLAAVLAILFWGLSFIWSGRLVAQGNSVLVIEHNLDVLKSMDCLIDMGPEGGRKGGYIVAQGTPEELAADPASVTGPFLKECLVIQ